MLRYDRIVSLAPSNTEILYALGVEDRVVATTAVCDHPDPVADKPSVGGWTNPDIDAVQEQEPDVVLASDALQDDAVQACRDAGLRVKQVTPRRFHDIFNSIKAVGEYVDAAEQAREIVDRMNEHVDGLAGTLDGERVYCEEWQSPVMVSGNWVPDMVDILGGRYLIDGGVRSREVTTGEIQAFDPEHILLHPCGYGDSAAPETVIDREGWEETAAVRQGNVHVIDDALLNRPSPRIVDGLAAIKNAVFHG